MFICEIFHQKIQCRSLISHNSNRHNITTIDKTTKKKSHEELGTTWVIAPNDTQCPRQECHFRCFQGTALRYHFRKCHPNDTLQHPNGTYNKCEKFGVYLTEGTDIPKHHHTKSCVHFYQRK